MVHPHIMPPNIAGEDATVAPRQPRVEYLATLSRHSAAVNAVRFSPNGRSMTFIRVVDPEKINCQVNLSRLLAMVSAYTELLRYFYDIMCRWDDYHLGAIVQSPSEYLW